MREQLLWAQRPSDRKSVCPWKCWSGPGCRLVRQTSLSSLGPAQGVTYANCDVLPTTNHGPAPGESHMERGHWPLAYCSRSLSQASVSLSTRKLRFPVGGAISGLLLRPLTGTTAGPCKLAQNYKTELDGNDFSRVLLLLLI